MISHQLAITIDGSYQIYAPAGAPNGGFDRLRPIIINSMIAFLVFLTIVVLFYLIWGGINWIMSQGDKAKLQAARNKITYAIVGLIIAFLSFAIVGTVGYFFNVNLLGGNLKTYVAPVCDGSGKNC